jgi:hypothetical protein
VKVDTKKDILEKARDDQDDVEQGPQTVDILLHVQRVRSV